MLSNRRSTLVALATAGVASLTLAATTSTEALPAAGTAASSMSAVTLSLTGVAAPSTVTVFEAGTLATTDAAHPGNVIGAPWAQASVTPLRVAGEAIGAVGARSDESGSAVAPASSAIGANIAAIDVAATAADDNARALIGASAATLDIIPGLVDLGISTLGIESVVTATQASNVQGVVLDGFDVRLGDLVPAEVLAALPIDVLLDLLATLPVNAPDLGAVTGAATALVDDVRTGVDGVVAATAGIETATAELAAAVTNLANQQAIVDGLEVDLTAAQAAAADAAAALETATTEAAEAAAATVGNLTGVAASCIGQLDVAGCLADLVASTQATLVTAQATSDAATATVDQLTADLAAATSLLDGLAATVDALTDVVDALVASLVSLLNDLLSNLNSLVDALTNLNSSLGDVVTALLDTELVGLDGLEAAMSAVATGVADTSTAGVVCELGDLTIAGINLGGGSCDGSTLTGSLTAALGTLNGALAALPLGDVVAIPTVTLDLLDVATSVTEADGVVTSTATVVPLVLNVPSVDIDPTGIVSGLLDQLQGDLLGNLLASLPVASTLDGLGLGDAAAQLQALTDTLSPALAEAATAVGGIVAQLPSGSDLVAFTTPGFNLEVDPTSTASFRAAAPGSDPAPAPAPLPATGGGAIVLGAAGLAGAWSLRRRS